MYVGTSCSKYALHTHPLADLCQVSTTEPLGHLGDVCKINVRGNWGFTEVGLEDGEARLQGQVEREEHSTTTHESYDHCNRGDIEGNPSTS